MDSGGGFLLNNEEISRNPVDGQSGTNVQTDEQSIEVRKLSQKQEVRLMNYLDDAFLQLSRNYAKRYTAPESSNVKTLDAYVLHIERLLTIVASIPPIGPSAQLLVNYLLRLTSETCDCIQGYELNSFDGNGQNKETVTKQLEGAVQLLNILDRIWASVLRGQMVNLAEVRKHVQENATEDIMRFPRGTAETSSSSRFEESSEPSGRYSNEERRSTQSESRKILGSRGFATVGQTHRIRIRNVITLAKENLFTWMRTQLDAPLPPRVERSEQDAEAERRDLIAVEGDIDQPTEQAQANENEDEEGIELEDVRIQDQRTAMETNGDGMGEQRHYSDLFSRTVDPDASDDEDDEEEKVRLASHKRSHSMASNEEKSMLKHRRVESGNDEAQTDRDTLVEPTEAESEATYLGSTAPPSMAVMRWDVAFAHLFGKTLRCLSDIQDYYDRKTTNEQVEGTEG